MDKIIEIKDLVFEYGQDDDKTRALSGINLDVERGEFLAVIGQNGSGKSTLAKHMNAILLPTSGSVVVNGYDSTDEEHLWDLRKSAGMVFQNPDNQLVSAIVEDDVAFGPENIGVESDKIRELVDEALASVRMSEFAEKAPHMLSGGQKQRIAIAGVIAMKPDCIIFDEPTAMLDPKGRADVLEIIKDLHKEGITIVLITHYMDEAVMADKVAVMMDGKVIKKGTPYEVFSDRETVEKSGMELPLATDISLRLKEKGVDLPDDILLADDLVEALCQLK